VCDDVVPLDTPAVLVHHAEIQLSGGKALIGRLLKPAHRDGPAGRLVAWDKATGKPVEPHFPLSIGLVEEPEQQLAARSGFVLVLPSFPPMASSTKCATV
jgi:hypothetical protein